MFCKKYPLIYYDMIPLWIIVIIKTYDKHYFDTDNINIGKPLNCHIAVNHVVQLTEEEKAEARRCAIEQYQHAQLAKLHNHSERTKKVETKIVQPSLFD